MSKDGTTLDATPTTTSPTAKVDTGALTQPRASTPSGVRKRVTAGAGKASRPGLRRSKTTNGHVFTKKRAATHADVDNLIQEFMLPANQSQDDGTATGAKASRMRTITPDTDGCVHAQEGAVEHIGVLRRVESDRPRSPRTNDQFALQPQAPGNVDTPAAPPVPRIKSSSRLKNGKPRPKAINLSTRPDAKEGSPTKKITESSQSPLGQTPDGERANPVLGDKVSPREFSHENLAGQLFCSQACYDVAVRGDSPDTSRPRTPLPSGDADSVVVKCSELRYDMPWLRPGAIRRRSHALFGFDDEEDPDSPFLPSQDDEQDGLYAPPLRPFGPPAEEPAQPKLGDNRRLSTTTELSLSFRRTPGALQASPTKGSPIETGRPLLFERSSHRRRQIQRENEVVEKRRHTVAFDGVERSDSTRTPWWLVDEREDWKTYWEARETGLELTFEEWQILRHRKRVEQVHREEQMQRFYQSSQRNAADDHKLAKAPLLIRVASQPMLHGFKAMPSPDRSTPTSPTSQRPRPLSRSSAPLEMTSSKRTSAKSRPVSEGLRMTAVLPRRSSAGVDEIRAWDEVNVDSSQQTRPEMLPQGTSKPALRRNRSLKALATIIPVEAEMHDIKTVSPIGPGPRSPLGMHSICAADVTTATGILQRVDEKKAKRHSLHDIPSDVSGRGNPRALPPLIIKEHASVRLCPSATSAAPQKPTEDAITEKMSSSPEAITATSISGSGSSGEESACDRITPRPTKKTSNTRPLSTGALISAINPLRLVEAKEESTASLFIKNYLPTFGSVPDQTTISHRQPTQTTGRTSLWGIFGSAKN